MTEDATPGWDPIQRAAARIGAREFLWWLVESPVFRQPPGWNPDPLRWPGYPQKREDARQATGLDEAVSVATGRLRSTKLEAVFVAGDFGFLGGSMGTVVGETIADAYDHARSQQLPVVLLTTSGGARLYEGMAALVQMPKTIVAAEQHARAGLLQIAVLRDPTTGGVFASHVNHADVLLAEPGATIGFAGPRVAAAMTDGRLPEGSHTAAGAERAGLVDAVVPRPDLPTVLERLLRWAQPDAEHEQPQRFDDPHVGEQDAWTQVQLARAPDRPRASEWLAPLDDPFELHGDREGTDDPTVRVVLGRVGGRRLVTLALDRNANAGRVTPAGYRKAWRGLHIADRLAAPVVVFIDTPGADASAPAEAGGIAAAIARTFSEVLACRPPIVAMVMGEGGSGGALCLTVGDRVLIQEHAVFSVIAPEGAAAILHRDPSRAAEVAALLRPTASGLAEIGIADEVVAEPEGDEVVVGWEAILRHLDEISGQPWPARMATRRRRWRGGGRA